jgi:hypothetical protein
MPSLNTQTSVVDYLKSVGQDSSFASRQKLAQQYGISGYTGSAEQNSSLLTKLQSGNAGTPSVNAPAVPTAVNNLDQAKSYVNSGQDADAAAAVKSDEPPIRTSVQSFEDITKQITDAISNSGIKKPESVSLTDTYTGLRDQYGLSSLETRLNDLNAQEEAAYAKLKERKDAENAKPVAQNVIEGRISEETKQAQDELDSITRQKNSVVNELKTKYDVVNTIMKYTETDYNNAVDEYDKSFSQALNIINTARGIQQDQKSDLERDQDNARANAQIVINTMTARGTTYTQLPQEQQLTLTKLGLAAGLGADFFSSVMNVSAGKEILTTITSADDTKATIVYKDGTTKTIATGLPAKKTTSTQTEAETKKSDAQKVANQLQGRVGRDGFVSPEDYKTARRAWVNAGYDASDFDTRFARTYVNPQDYETAGVSENSIK